MGPKVQSIVPNALSAVRGKETHRLEAMVERKGRAVEPAGHGRVLACGTSSRTLFLGVCS